MSNTEKSNPIKFQIASDIHREFHKTRLSYIICPRYDDCQETILLVPGDFFNGAGFHERAERKAILAEFEVFAKQYKKVIYTFGNHEHYGSYPVQDAIDLYRKKWPKDNKITFLENDYVILEDEGVAIYGGTMWANFCEDRTLWGISLITESITDFKAIKDHTAAASIKYYDDYVVGLKNFVDKTVGYKRVVLSHFAPFQESIHEKYYGNKINQYFVNNLELTRNYRDSIDLWVHGHCHDNFDYVYKPTDGSRGIRVICNPHGYPYENNKYKKQLIVEL